MSEHAIVVTGSSSGIGAAVARRLAAPDRYILVHYRENRAGASEVADAIRGQGAQCDLVCGDIATEQGRSALLDKARQLAIPLQAWVHMAGADVLTAARDMPFADKLDLLYRVDVRGTILLAKAALPLLRTAPASAPRPSMVLVGWDHAFTGMEGDAGELFCPIKAAVMAFTKSFAHNAGPDVRVNCVAPGWIKTAWGNETSSYWNARAEGESISNRWGRPEDVAAAVEWLIAAESDFVNGQIIEVNGGWRRSDHAPLPRTDKNV